MGKVDTQIFSFLCNFKYQEAWFVDFIIAFIKQAKILGPGSVCIRLFKVGVQIGISKGYTATWWSTFKIFMITVNWKNTGLGRESSCLTALLIFIVRPIWNQLRRRAL
jgi:hypothetical protein